MVPSPGPLCVLSTTLSVLRWPGLLLCISPGQLGGVWLGSAHLSPFHSTQSKQPPAHPLHPALQNWVGDPTAALDPLYPTGFGIGNRVFSGSTAKRQLIQILILGKNPPNHCLYLSGRGQLL